MTPPAVWHGLTWLLDRKSGQQPSVGAAHIYNSPARSMICAFLSRVRSSALRL